MSVHVNFVVALRSEAQPLIEHYDMRLETQTGGLHIYAGENMHLAISGIGATASATAVGFLARHHQSPNQAWINLGIAGHQKAKLGQVFLVNKIIGVGPEHTQFPSICFASPLPGATLHTVTTPQTNYARNTLYDMEGAAFFAAAARFTSVELISLLKVVSDNQSHPIAKITKSVVNELISDSLPRVTEFVEDCRKLANTLDAKDDSCANFWLKNRRASATQRIKFTQLHHRLTCLTSEREISSLLENIHDTQQAISILENHLDSVRLYIP